MVITGMVVGVGQGDRYWVAPDRDCLDTCPQDCMVHLSRVIDGRVLTYHDRVEFECEETDKGFRAKWCKWIGHGGKPAKQILEVEGSGYILRDANNRAGSIKPDVKGADVVRFLAGNVRYKNHRRGDRVTFTAHQDRSGRWLATSVKAEIEVWGGLSASTENGRP